MKLGVRVLGAPEAYAEGAWLPLTPTRPHAALAYLAVRGGLVRRAELAALLWPDADTQSAHAGLRQVLMRLDRGLVGGRHGPRGPRGAGGGVVGAAAQRGPRQTRTSLTYGGEVTDVDADDDGDLPNDASILDEVEGWLGGWVGPSEVAPH